MTNLDSILKSWDTTLPTKVCLVKAIVFPVVMYGCESWTVKKAEYRKIDAFELWCWRRLLRVPWRPPLTHTFSGDSWTPTGNSGTVSCGVTFPFSYVLLHNFLLCPPRLYFPVLYKFWQLYCGINGDLLQEDLCQTHTQSPCPCGRSLLAHISAGGAQTEFCLSFCRIPGSWCA